MSIPLTPNLSLNMGEDPNVFHRLHLKLEPGELTPWDPMRREETERVRI